jgi:hypothetical protein
LLFLYIRPMKFGFRISNLNKRIAARTSVKRAVQNSLGLKAPRGMGWITNPQRAAYNRVYNRTSKGCMFVWLVGLGLLGTGYWMLRFGEWW